MSIARPTPARPRRHWFLWLLLCALVGAGAYAAVVSTDIVVQSGRDESRPADAIVVFGAAEYSGRPSPVFRARLDHAYTLYRRHLAPYVIVTGGAGGDPKFSEGGVGRHYLEGRGVPEDQIIAETQGDNTLESAERIAVIMKANGLRSCDAVSDGYHMFRLKKMLEREGIVAYAAPRPELRPPDRWHRALLVARELASYTLWRLHIPRSLELGVSS
jgi:uncharacterized SAM-binding protein YcdF (DUF218 family)